MSASQPPIHSAAIEQAGDPTWKKALPLIIIVLLFVAAGWAIHKFMGKAGSSPKRQTVNIAVLPNTPPPPPPKEEKKPEPPKEEPKQQMQMAQPKVAEAPPQQAESLKMDGPAGDGPSAFAAGAISKDYEKGALITGGATATTSGDRAKFMFYANNARQMLRAELDKTLPGDVLSLGARLRIWIESDGTIARFQVMGVSDKTAEDKLRQAMDLASKSYRLPAPAGMPQPLELRLSVNPANG